MKDMKTNGKFQQRIKSHICLLIIMALLCPMIALPPEAKAASKSVEVSNFTELQNALADATVDTIIVTSNINVDVSYDNSKSTTALLVADRNLTIMGKDAQQFTIKRTGTATNTAKSLLEIWGNGTYDGIQVSIYNIIFDGGAVFAAGSTAAIRYGTSSPAYTNTGISGHGVIDIANKGTLNMENGAYVINGVSTSNSNTRNSQGMAHNSGSSPYGGGIRVDFLATTGGGTVNMKAGSAIYDCYSSGWGGGIGAYNYARLNLYGGTISRCASNNGAAISVTYRGNTAANTGGSIKVFGGTITDCYSPGNGAALYIDAATTNYLLGGTFINNTSGTANTGGVVGIGNSANLYLGDKDRFTLSGNTAGNYADNTRGSAAKNWTTADGVLKGTNATILKPQTQTVTFMMDSKQYAQLVCPYGTPLGEAFPGDPVASNGYFNGWFSGTQQYTKTSYIMSDLTLTGRMHYHDFTYTEQGATVSAYCQGEYECPYKSSALEFTLNSMGDMEYNRRRYPGVEIFNSITNVTGAAPSDVTYYRLTAEGETPVLSNNMNAKPVDIGEYCAKATIGGATARLDFRIYAGIENYTTMSLDDTEPLMNAENSARIARSSDIASNLRVYLPNADVEVKLYKIGEMLWSDINQDYYDPRWVQTVRSWIEDHDDYNTSSAFMDPLSLSKSAANVQIDFYGNLLNDDSNLFDTEGYNIPGPARISSNAEEGTDTFYGKEGETDYIQFSNLPIGIYAVLAQGDYMPMVVSVLPYQQGPQTQWFLAPLFTVNIKTVALTLNKFIDGEDISDTVEMGEIVPFDIELSKLDLYHDRLTLPYSAASDENDTSVISYTLSLKDYLSEAYELEKDSQNQILAPVLKFRYDADDEPLTENGFTPDADGFYAFPDSFHYFAFGDERCEEEPGAVLITEDNYSDYLNNGKDLLQEMSAKSQQLYAIPQDGPFYVILFNDHSDPADTSTFSVYFNVEAIKIFVHTYNLDDGSMTIVLSYNATVTSLAEMGTDANYNRVELTYEKAKGLTDLLEDTVYGYTYGLQVVKIDGDTAGTDHETYLDGATFRLYKEIEEDPLEGELYYEYDVRDKESGETITRYFEPYTKAALSDGTTLGPDGTFLSTASAEGITLNGLKEGSYILVEVTPKQGYNNIAEDLYFEINKLDSLEANQMYMGRYNYFYEMNNEDGTQGALIQTGYLSFRVLNYKGFLLPTTGGVGTLLCILTGLGIMLTSCIMVIYKKKQNLYESQVFHQKYDSTDKSPHYM